MSDEKDLGLFGRDALLTKLPSDARVIERAQVEQVARILGEGSQAAQALARANAHGGNARFWYSSESSMLWLELPQESLH